MNFERRYKGIVFLPSKVHPNIGVLNRYYGVMENGKGKLRGVEIRRHDTPRFIYDAQTEMINVLASSNNTTEYLAKIPEALDVIKQYRSKLLNDEVPVWDLIVTIHLWISNVIFWEAGFLRCELLTQLFVSALRAFLTLL